MAPERTARRAVEPDDDRSGNSSSSEGSRLSSSVAFACASTVSSGATGPRTWQRTTRPSTCTELTPGTPDRSGTGPSKVASTVSALRCRIWASVPSSASLPARRMATRSHSASTSLMMCEDKKTVWPRSRASRMAARNACSISGSSPLVGSSRTSRSARVIKAAIRMTFCRLPLE